MLLCSSVSPRCVFCSLSFLQLGWCILSPPNKREWHGFACQQHCSSMTLLPLMFDQRWLPGSTCHLIRRRISSNSCAGYLRQCSSRKWNKMMRIMHGNGPNPNSSAPPTPPPLLQMLGVRRRPFASPHDGGPIVQDSPSVLHTECVDMQTPPMETICSDSPARAEPSSTTPQVLPPRQSERTPAGLLAAAEWSVLQQAEVALAAESAAATPHSSGYATPHEGGEQPQPGHGQCSLPGPGPVTGDPHDLTQVTQAWEDDLLASQPLHEVTSQDA